MRNLLPLSFLVSLFLLSSCNSEEEPSASYATEAENPVFLHQTIDNLTETIVNDVFSPPLASRVYLYPILAAYEVLQQTDPSYQSLKGQLHGFEGIPNINREEEYVLQLAAVIATIEVGKKLVYTPDLIKNFESKILEDFKALGIPKAVFSRSVNYGKSVAEAILAYSSTDKYKESRTLSGYTVTAGEEEWKPTPPMFASPIEPNWNTLRPLVLDSAQQFAPPPPTPYNMDKKSTFYKEVLEVYQAVNNLNDEQGAIAEFWDCNPFAVEMQGHLHIPTKKISPGGHWIGIAKMASIQSNATLVKTAEAYIATAIALFDGFISCWDEKYRSKLIRPETVINQKGIDPNWKPLLQTPPFPEYTSGHSVVSAASSVALTQVFGENFAYVDSVEVSYGLPPRSYNSFYQASEEAAISRLYGGIHYMPAISNGVTQGRNVGRFIFENIKFKKS